MKLVVGTRGSRLSLIQTDLVVKKLVKSLPDLKIQAKMIKTTGDKMANKPLLQIKEKGIFEREVDRAVIEGEVDFAVHSMKDVPVIENSELYIAAVPQRAPPNDAFVSEKYLGLAELPVCSVVGTGSPRREAQLHHVRPDVKVKPIRGNVDTRVKKLEKGLYDAIILAEAGLNRLKLNRCPTERLPLEQFTPTPGQGALAVVTRKDREVVNILRHVNHPPSMAEILSERAFVREIGGGCKVPIGAVARAKNDSLSLYAVVLSPDGRTKIRASQFDHFGAPEQLGVKVAEEMRRLGVDRLIYKWREAYG